MLVIVSKTFLWILLTTLCVEFVATFRDGSYCAQVVQRSARPAEYSVEVVEPTLMAATADRTSPATAPAAQ